MINFSSINIKKEQKKYKDEIQEYSIDFKRIAFNYFNKFPYTLDHIQTYVLTWPHQNRKIYQPALILN